MASAVSPADPLHGIHGAREWQHVPGNSAAGEKISCCGIQLGSGGRKDANIFSMGLLGEAVHGPPAPAVAPRYLPNGRKTVPRGGDGIHQVHRQGPWIIRLKLPPAGYHAGRCTNKAELRKCTSQRLILLQY